MRCAAFFDVEVPGALVTIPEADATCVLTLVTTLLAVTLSGRLLVLLSLL
jgi:hypothetical protein